MLFCSAEAISQRFSFAFAIPERWLKLSATRIALLRETDGGCHYPHHSKPPGKSAALYSRWTTRRWLGATLGGDEWMSRGRINSARRRVLLRRSPARRFSTYRAISPLGMRPWRCVCRSRTQRAVVSPGVVQMDAQGDGPSMDLTTGGCTCTIPYLLRPRSKPGISTRSMTVMVQSWCHGTSQLASSFLSK